VLLKKFASQGVKLYKNSSWNPAPLPDVEDFAGKIDYAFVGVGA